jgi:hypothetical protein
MHTDWDNNGASLHIKFVPETGVFMQVWNPAWKFGDNAKPVPVTIGFDRRPNYMSGDATPETAKLDRGSIGVLTTNLGGHQEKAEDRDRAVLDFLDNFADADDMWLDFGNNHIRWHAKMDGSRSAARVLAVDPRRGNTAAHREHAASESRPDANASASADRENGEDDCRASEKGRRLDLSRRQFPPTS